MNRAGLKWFVLGLVATLTVFVLVGCQVTSTDDDAVSDANVDTPTVVDDANEQRDDPETINEPHDDTETSDSDFPVVVTRTDGIELTIERAPERIVSMSAGATEILFEIGAHAQLVAVDMFSDYPAQTADIPKVDAFQPDPEAIVDLDPDLVIVIYNADGIVEVLDNLDVPVLFLDAPESLYELLDHIILYGEVTGNRASAEDVASDLERRINTVVERVDGLEGPRIYHELDDTYFTVGPNSFVGHVYELLGAENIAGGGLGDYPQLSEEVIVDRDPEVIILPGYAPEDGALIELVRSRDGWDQIAAVVDDRIYEMDGDIISRPGPRVIEALEQLAALLYPEEFATSHEPAIPTSVHAQRHAA